MQHPCLSYLRGEADALDLEAARIEAAVRLGVDMPNVAKGALERSRVRIQRMAGIEAQTLGAVLAEHRAVIRGTPLQSEWDALRKGWVQCRRIEADLVSGEDCSDDLRAYAACLHQAAAVERDQLLPWAEQELGESLLREADARLAAYTSKEPEVAVDWSAFAS